MGRAQAGGWRQSLQPKGLLNVSQWLWQQEQLGSETEVGTLIIDDRSHRTTQLEEDLEMKGSTGIYGEPYSLCP